ncbi:MAG: hypothetical protein HQK75_13890, partial [Candidatus Magnetomorum sp.]|nr:hypothetical protein [Candidatus Magnetomorum sp.]
DLILNAIGKKPQSSAQLKNYFPIPNNRLVDILTQLVSSGKICVELTPKHTLKLSLNKTFQESQILNHVQENQNDDDRTLMKRAYQDVCNGRIYVRIHEVRDYLKWSRDRFDRTLESLAGDFVIQLHYGDPSILTENELKNSYMDDEGEICITLTWRTI